MFMLFPRTIRSIAHLTALTLFACATALAGSITYYSPTSGSTVSSPIHVHAQASSSSSVLYSNLYLDGHKVAGVSGGTLDKYISAGSGSHRIVVQAKDSSGSLFSKAIYVKVGTSSTSTSSKTYYNIDQMSKWSSCSACAGSGGSGPTAYYSQTLYISSPSMDGKSSKFHIGGSSPYANALWWKQLGANSSAHHFKYDLYFYLKNPSAAQALEFDVNQSVNGKKYIFGAECTSARIWKVYSASLHWVNTGIGCPKPTAYKWHHLTWEFQRTSGGNVQFIAVTLDGVKHYVNRTYGPKSSSASEINVAFQMDGNKYMTDYDTWLDKVKLTYW
ncbi:MAG TPA: hypothetical protein VFU86_22075 [Terriglobales bacterium]|nr:hypothetical protein [Terriglobales bacterium]